MAKKKNRRAANGYQLPPHVERARQAASRAAGWKPGPKPPQRRVILAGFGMSLLCLGMTAAFWFPAHALAEDLRSRGVTSAATVVGIDNKPQYVKVRLVSGPRTGDEVEFSDYAGMYPDVHRDEAMIVTYDPQQPSRVLSRDWVEDPPANLPAYGTAALTLLCLSLTTTAVIRRLRILRRSGPGVQPGSSAERSDGQPCAPRTAAATDREA
ncbi:hypothetical protein AB0937_13295 [Streptomyces sp. NPDC047880]|uniref:hypothetical protein n=1 Tax=Streptomyces sp. NPDC047880 TaxID=3155626 RepID=UPI003456E869